MDEQQPIVEENESLESPTTVIEKQDGNDAGAGPGVASAPDTGSPTPTSSSPEKPGTPLGIRLHLLFRHLNIYVLLLVIIVSILIGITIFSIRKNNQAQPKVSTATETLSNQTLEQIEGSDIKVGDTKQTLNIESNTIFSGKVLVRDSVDIAGSLKVGGTLSLAGIDISGTSLLDEAQLKTLSVTGTTTIQGPLSVQNNLNVSGSASFGGNITAPQITVDTLELNKDLKISRHIVTSGGTPSRSNGASIGAGGTSSISGSDTAGTATINTGSNATAGCLINVTFSQAFAGSPHIIITPASSNAAALDFYTSRSNTGFSICTASDPADGSAGMVFDYIVIG